MTITGNKSTSSARKSNLELYRIIIMILIIAHHYVVNSGVLELMYRLPLNTKSNYMFILGGWGKFGINCYIFITGYFMCKKEITFKKYLQSIIEIARQKFIEQQILNRIQLSRLYRWIDDWTSSLDSN